MGAHVNLIGAVGDDSFGKSMLAHLQAEGIHTEGVTTVSDETTGVANIILSEADNRIIVAPGANDFVLPELVDQYEEKIGRASCSEGGKRELRGGRGRGDEVWSAA